MVKLPERFHRGKKPSTLLSYIRYTDAIIGQSLSVVGLVFFVRDLSIENVLRALLLSVGSFLLMAYIFSINDWADLESDEQHDQKQTRAFSRRGMTSQDMLALSVSLGVAGTLIVTFVSKALGLIALMIILLGFAYSLPVRHVRGKGIPILSSFLHFAGALLTFLLGSMVFSPVDARALWIGSYFGILLMAGHLVQEIQDHAGDRLSKIQTNAVRFGPKPVFIASFALFSLSFVFVFGLAQSEMIPGILQYIVILYPVYAVLAARAYRAGLDRESVLHLRSLYRKLFAMVVLLMLAAALLARSA